MHRDKTGRRYEAHGQPATLQPLWSTVKQSYPDAHIITVTSENIAVIGSDDPAAMALITRKAKGQIITIDREAYHYTPPYLS